MCLLALPAACSSSLVATHLAWQHLQEHRTWALAAGVNTLLLPGTTGMFNTAGTFFPKRFKRWC